MTARGIFLGALAAFGALLMLEKSPREKVVQAALSRLGATDASEFWTDTLPGMPRSSWPPDWCGAFVLWCLHQAGLARQIIWTIGTGFLDNRFPQTRSPEPGDVAYFDHNQHQAIVRRVEPNGMVSLVNGNGAGAQVTLSQVPLSSVTAFFSLKSLLKAST